MSGMLGAIAIASVSASRHAEGGGGVGGAVACSAGFSAGGLVGAVGASGGFSATGLEGSTAGASAGRGFGSGTDTGNKTVERTDLRGLGLFALNSLPHGNGSARRAAAGPDGTPSDSNTTAAVTIAAPVRPQGHLRVALSALNFMSIP
jgi:hypothetical protein